LTTRDPRWGAILAGMRHDFYQLPEYAVFAAAHQEPGTPMAYVAEGAKHRLLIPLILRDVVEQNDDGPPLQDATSPRGFPGPIIDPADEPEVEAFVDDALAAFEASLQDRGVVCAFIRLHPLLGPSLHCCAVTVCSLISVSPSPSIWDDRMRSCGSRCERTTAGYRPRVADGLQGSHGPEWRQFDSFVEAFRESMARLDAAPQWRLSSAYLAGLREALGDRIHLCVVEKNGELASASLITEADGIVEYHLAGTFDEHVRASPSKLIIHFVTSWARARGNRLFHLAGSPRPSDSLNHFKVGFSSSRHRMQSWRVIAQRDAYDALVHDWERKTGIPADPKDGYFPAYRRPSGTATPSPATGIVDHHRRTRVPRKTTAPR